MTIAPETRSVDGAPTRYLLAGPADAPKLLFLHGATPGVTPYCGGAHIWGGILDRFAGHRRVLAPDLVGSGGSFVPGGAPPTIDAMTRQMRALIEALAFRPCHVIGHDIGGLVALSLAIEAPALVASVTVAASAATAPTGDMVQNLTLAHPPQPLWSRESQLWALERLSLAHLHIDEPLIAACVAAAAGEPHRAAVSAIGGANFRKIFAPTVGKAKTRFFEVCRQDGLQVPVQVIWATHDPMTTVDQGLWVFRLIAGRQRATQFHLINRASSLLFREQPEQFHQLVAAFQDGLAPGRNQP